MTTKRDITTIIGAVLGLLTSIYLGCFALSWLTSLVPVTEPHYAIIRLAIGFVALWAFLGLGILLTIGMIWLFGWFGHLAGGLLYKRGGR